MTSLDADEAAGDGDAYGPPHRPGRRGDYPDEPPPAADDFWDEPSFGPSSPNASHAAGHGGNGNGSGLGPGRDLGSGHYGGGRSSGFERTAPQDLGAEQSALGGMLLSKDAIADVIDVVKGRDFYKSAHELIFESILDLYGRGEPADAVTVSAELTKRGELARIGGAPYLHTLMSSVPIAANAGYYGVIVRERAILRRLVEAGTRIAQMGYTTDGADLDEIVGRAQAEIFSVTEQRAAEDYAPLADIMEGALDEIESIEGHCGQRTGVPTGFADLDALTGGLHPGQMVIVAARPAMGKALALDTPLPTPTGWTTMGDVQVGDQLIGAGGRPCTVMAATEVMLGRPCYEVEFSDGTVIVADAEHQWLTWDSKTRKAYDYANPDGPPYPENWPSWVPPRSASRSYASGSRDQMRAMRAAGLSCAQIGQRLGRTATAVQQQWNRDEPPVAAAAPRTTREIAATLRVGHRNNHAIPAVRGFDGAEGALPIAPYVLGYLLGDGDTAGAGRVACDPRDRAWLIDEFTAAGYDARPHLDPGHFGVRGLQQAWSSLGLPAGKHVPTQYLRSSRLQRIALVQGLIDSDGTIDGHGAYRFTSTNAALVEAFRELVISLGCVPQTHHRAGRMRAGRLGAQSWDVIVPTGLTLARLPRKALAARRSWKREQITRYITDVRPVESGPVRCVQVDSADHMYVAGRTWIPTHNSTLGLDIARSCSIKNGLTSVLFSLEMGRNEIAMRLLSAEARVALHRMRSGAMAGDDWARLAQRMGEVSGAPLFIDDSPNLSMMEIRAKCRRLKQRHDLRLVIVDYLQLMSGGGSRRSESRQQEVSEMSRALKLLAKELEIPLIAVAQLNRGPEQRTDKRPMMSDLRESGSLEQDADIVILLHREDAYERESPRAGEADLIVAKHRNGPTATITLAFQGHYSRFVDMAQS